MSGIKKTRSLCYTCSAKAKNTEIHIDESEVKVIYNSGVKFNSVRNFIYEKILIDDRVENCNVELRGVLRKTQNNVLSIRLYDVNKNMIASFAEVQ